MAKKNTSPAGGKTPSRSRSTKKTAAPAEAPAIPETVLPDPVSGPVRNTAIPKVPAASPAKKEVTHEAVAKRAYEIYLSGTGGTAEDNWLRAERELRGGGV